MKRTQLFLTLVMMGTLAAASSAQSSAGDDAAFFKKQIGSLVKIEPTPMVAAAEIGKVFKGAFFKVDVTVSENTSTIVAVRVGDTMVQANKPSSTEAMPELVKLVKPEFKLSGDADGKVFEGALDAIYPIDTTFDQDDLKVKAIQHKGTEWTFIRGKFFEHFKGFVVSTKADGTITGIKYSLEIP